jgi:hypothetical protein
MLRIPHQISFGSSNHEELDGQGMQHYEEQERCAQDFVGKSEGRPKRRWEDNIKMDIQEVVWSMEWIDLAQNRDR